jgi:hypothetical protein
MPVPAPYMAVCSARQEVAEAPDGSGMVILVWCGLSPEVMSLSSVKRSFAQSAAFLERSRRSRAGGVSSPFRARAPIPLFVQDARGSRFTDVDGNESSTMRGPRRTGL